MRTASLVVAALALARAHRAGRSAGGFGIPDIGVRRTAMGAVIGRPDEGAAIYHNPAGLVLQPGWHLYLSTGLAVVRTEFQLALVGPRAIASSASPPAPTATTRRSGRRRAMGVIPMLALTGEIIPGKLVARRGALRRQRAGRGVRRRTRSLATT